MTEKTPDLLNLQICAALRRYHRRMKVTLVFNPIAGAGRAKARAGGVARALEAAGFGVHCVPSEKTDPEAWLDPRLADADAVVVAGGDGTVRLAAGAAIRTHTPVYHFPLGTENLFAREFGFDRSEDRLVETLARREVRMVDMGVAGDLPFLLMVSVGYDAEVVHDLASRRAGSISHASYVLPMVRQMFRWRPSCLMVTVDGQRLDDDLPGFVVIANSRQYGMRLDPAREAIIDDGWLDVVFFPTRSRIDLIRWLWRCRRGTQGADPRLRTARGREVRVDCEEPRRFQIDGDRPDILPSQDAPPTTPLDVSLQTGVLPVLMPPCGGE